MIPNPKIIKTAGAVLSAIRPFFFAVLGGVVVGAFQKCEKQQPVNLIVTNQQYEKQISDLRVKQDSINAVLPDMAESVRYMSERYKPK
ncbi:hypothetical protein [Dyadobacter aurulentus]|uniref:hypothetical protein n=1 Tax=Dyadobacter sp. UC 10 TaxID=2605428 RepID=UPI0011F0FD9E|nr:hypothetical protein [Dyadobacter sp. UC 10]KAA0992778.1 hypothetical protein FXO21_22665 [Dyadobacter sp. UC 10]